LAVLGGRAAGDLPEDAVELRIASEAGCKRSIEQSALTSFTAKFKVIEEPLNTLAIAKLNDGEAGLLFEEPAEP
jgi:hypothetical protein